MRARAGLILAMLALWLAAPAVDWRAVPWGLPGVETDFFIALAELLIAAALAGWALSRLDIDPARDFALLIGGTFVGLLVLELMYWQVGGGEFRLFDRQWDGVKVAPVAAILAALPLLGLKAANRWPSKTHIRNSRFVLGGAVLASFVPFLLRDAQPHSAEMLDTMAFALLVTGFGTAVGISLGGLPILGKARD